MCWSIFASRYGKQIRYDPPVDPWTAALWVVPAVLFAGLVLTALSLSSDVKRRNLHEHFVQTFSCRCRICGVFYRRRSNDFSTSGYSTGEALEKPMVMKPFVEFSKARPLPELRIFTLEGEKVDLAKYRGKLLILNVWGTWCTPCIREIPQLIDLQKQLKGSNIEIVGVAVEQKRCRNS